MAERPVGSILVNNRTISIAGEVVAIKQIVRLRELEHKERKGFSPERVLLIVIGGFVALYSANSGSASVWTTLGLIAALAAVLYSLYSTKKYILAIELASGSFSGLTSNTTGALTDLKDAIAGVIENPPTQPTTINVRDIYAVDSRGSRNMQIGSGNSQINF
jgi:hypothetical protein